MVNSDILKANSQYVGEDFESICQSGPIRDSEYVDACAYFNIILLLYGHDNVTPPLTGLITIAFGRLLCVGTSSRRAHIHGIGGGSY